MKLLNTTLIHTSGLSFNLALAAPWFFEPMKKPVVPSVLRNTIFPTPYMTLQLASPCADLDVVENTRSAPALEFYRGDHLPADPSVITNSFNLKQQTSPQVCAYTERQLKSPMEMSFKRCQQDVID